MAELQKPFRGLSGFLGLFRGGNVGMDFNRQIQPVLEMDDWLGPNDWIIQTFNLAADGNRASTTIPDDEFWRLKWGSVYIDPLMVINSDIKLNKEVTAGGTTFNVPLSPMMSKGSSSYINLAAEEGGYGVDLRPHNGQPGEKIGVQRTRSSAAGGITGFYFYQFQRIKV